VPNAIRAAAVKQAKRAIVLTRRSLAMADRAWTEFAASVISFHPAIDKIKLRDEFLNVKITSTRAPMRSALPTSVVLCSLLAGCGHVPLTSLPKLSKIDIKTTDLSQLRAGISLPSDIRTLPGGVSLTLVAMPKDGGRHERKVVLEEVRDAVELAKLPVMVAPGRRFTLFKLGAVDAARLGAFRQEMFAGAQNSGNRGSLSLGADKACRLGELSGKPIAMSGYLKTSETQDYVLLMRDFDLRKAVREIDPKIDLAIAIPPCDEPALVKLSGSRAAP
jgi:hypothetical protein